MRCGQLEEDDGSGVAFGYIHKVHIYAHHNVENFLTNSFIFFFLINYL